MSGSAIRDGLKNTLTTSSAFSTAEVTVDDWGILGRTSNCAIVIGPASEVRVDFHSYGRNYGLIHTYPVFGYVRDTGDPTRVPSDAQKLQDELIAALQADESLNSTACAIESIAIRMPQAPTGGPVLLDIGGQSWMPVFMDVSALEVRAKS